MRLLLFCLFGFCFPCLCSDAAEVKLQIVHVEFVSDNCIPLLWERQWKQAVAGHDRLKQREAAQAFADYWCGKLDEYDEALDAALDRLFLEWKGCEGEQPYLVQYAVSMRSSLLRVRQAWRRYAVAEEALVGRMDVPDGVDRMACVIRCRAVVAMQHLMALHAHLVWSLRESPFFADPADVCNDDEAKILAAKRDDARTTSMRNVWAEESADYWEVKLVGLESSVKEKIEAAAVDAARTAWLEYRAAMVEALVPISFYAGTGTPAAQLMMQERLTRQRCTNVLFYSGAGEIPSGEWFDSGVKRRYVFRR